MSYVDHFRHADDVITHLKSVVPTIADPLLVAKYSGFVTVAAVTVYELAIKDIFCEFGRQKHKVLGHFTEAHFDRINGRVGLDNIRKDYCAKFGDAYLEKFKRKLDAESAKYLKLHRRDVKSSYGNLITWRHNFAHNGAFPTTATFAETIQAYEDGKQVIHALAAAMTR